MALVEINPDVKIPTEALNFFQRVLGPFAEAGDFLSDKIRFYRWRSSIETMARAQQVAKDRGLNVNEVPLRVLVPLLEHASLETEDSPLIQTWAELLAASAANPDKAKATYVSVLSRIDAADVKLLDQLAPDNLVADLMSSPMVQERSFDRGAASNITAQVSATEVHIIGLVTSAPIANGNNFLHITNDLHRKFINFLGFSGSLCRFERIIVSYDKKVEPNNIYFENPMFEGPSVDTLISAGLVTRRDIFHQTPSYKLQLSIIHPTVFGLSFVAACRGAML